MNSYIIINNSQEKEIDKILQEGIDKSLLYRQTLQMNNSNELPKYSTVPLPGVNNRTYSKKNTFNKKRKISKNKEQNLSSLSSTGKNTFPNNTKIRSKSINKSKTIKKKSQIFDYQLEYNKKKEELEKYKAQLVQERIKQNKLQREMNSKVRKEEEFKKIEKENNDLQNNSDELILKIQRSEKIREEQSILIDRLLKEYNSLISALRNNPGVEIINKYKELESEAESLRNEEDKKEEKKKRKLNKKAYKKK